MPLPSSVTCSGLPGIRALRFPLARGVTPSIAAVYCSLPGDIDPSGPLRLSFSDASLEFPDMAVAAVHERKHDDKKWATHCVYLKDRRWRWAGKTISGDWNRRMANGTLDTATVKTPSELAALLLNALGESGYDVSNMPANVRPRCLWQNAPADEMLKALCDYVACEVVLNPLSNNVEIWPSGVGEESATGAGEKHPKRRFVPRACVPSRVVVNCGHSLWQSKLQLKAVARNHTTGQQRLLSSWDGMPAGGLSTESPLSFPNVTDTNNRVRAFEDYLRTFVVTGQENGSLSVGTFPFAINSVEQYVLNDYLLDTETDLAGYKRNLPYYIDGDYWAYTDVAANASNQRFTGPSKLHADRRLVEFEFPVFKLTSSGAYQEPTLYLTTSYRLRTAEGEFGYIKRFGSVGGSGGDLTLDRPELFSVYGPINTQAETIAEADAYVTLFQRKYQNPYASEITYPGLVYGSLDGYKAQVTWEWSVNEAPRTTVCEGDELDATARRAA